jgi:hypothetical protein
MDMFRKVRSSFGMSKGSKVVYPNRISKGDIKAGIFIASMRPMGIGFGENTKKVQHSCVKKVKFLLPIAKVSMINDPYVFLMC